MRVSEQFASFINFSIALFCLLVGGFLAAVLSFEQFYNFFFLYLKTVLKETSIIFLSLGALLFIGLRFQEGKKTIRLKTNNTTYEIDKKILQDKILRYFHVEKKLHFIETSIKITKEQILEINIQSKVSLKKQDFNQWEKDLKKIFREVGYNDVFYFNYTQSI